MRNGAQSVLRRLARLARGENASEIAEAAAVLPLMFTVLLGIFWFGQAFSTYGTITRAAQEGARAAAAASACTTCAAGSAPASNAYAAVQNVLTVAKLDPLKAAWPATPPALLICNTGASSSCAASPSNVCVQMNVQLTVRAGGGVGVCGVSVSFQYPFKFWLPFTSLNKQQVLLNASARVRSETH
jgi:Flp pilus assembly protein TadG